MRDGMSKIRSFAIGTIVALSLVLTGWFGREAVGFKEVKEAPRPPEPPSVAVVTVTNALVTCSEELGPRSCYRCNQYLYCTEQFIPKLGVSTSEAIGEVLRICRENLSPGFINDWSGFTYESLKSRGDEGLLFGLSVFLVYLALVAYCESWRRAFWRILPSVSAAFGAVAAPYLSGVAFSVYSRYALLMLVSSTVAMSLLTESLPTFRKRAVLPILAALTMLPLVFASGAGSAGSCSLGMTFFGGYAACALLSGFLAAAPRSVVQTERKESL